MIVAQSEKSKAIMSLICAQPDCSHFPPEQDELCRSLSNTIIDPEFPGALIPVVLPNQGIRIIAAATPSDWRRLSPVLQAFAGPTVTSFNGLPVQPPPMDPVATILTQLGPLTTSFIELPADATSQQSALRALNRARETFARAPRLNRSAPEPTSWLLARFQDHLNMGRRDFAVAVLDRLRDELRLDALNLKALQIQLFATFDDWAAITQIQGFQNLTVARRTPTVTGLLLEALYQVHLAAHFDDTDLNSVKATYTQIVRPLALPMLTLPAPVSLLKGGWRLFALEGLVSPSRDDLRSALQPKLSTLGWIEQEISQTLPKPIADPAPLDRARELVVANEASESVDVLAAAVAAIARLSPEQRADLARAEPFSSALRVVEQESEQAEPPTSWLLWLSRLSDPTFTNALEVARFGAEEWPISSEVVDPTEVRALSDSLGKAQADDLAAERTAQALPFLVAAVRRDPHFPSPALAPVYSSLLTILVLGASRGGAIYDSSQVLIEALLAVGLDQRDYRSLTEDIDELAGEGVGVDMIFWTLEVIETFMRHAAPDVEAREALMHRLIARIVGLRMRLSSLQLAALRRLVVEFGWADDGLEISPGLSDQDDFASRLVGKRVAIYSLLETASRQAKAALEAGVPGVSVDCNADSGGTSRLRALAQNSDIFIIVWAAAKHAATDFIREHRGNRTLLYAQGKGFSSLLRALEDHLKLSGKV
jgi:hypothetical protein